MAAGTWVDSFLAHPTGEHASIGARQYRARSFFASVSPAPLPRSPFDQHEPSVLAHPPPGNVHLVDLEQKQRQALGFAHAICTDCVSVATVRRDGNPIGCTLGRIGHSWFGTIMAPTTSRTAPLPWGLVIRSGYPRRQLACEITNRRSDQLIRGGYWADTFPVDLFLGRAGSWP